jgi:pyruvate dehydrogenase complex dehydrogenase (E1) component
MGKIVATRSSGSAQGRKRAAVQSQRVTNVVQTDGVSQLRKKHADHMTPCTERARHGIHTDLARKFRNQMCWNQIAKLSENSELGCGWFGVSFHHLCRVTKLKTHANHFFLS